MKAFALALSVVCIILCSCKHQKAIPQYSSAISLGMAMDGANIAASPSSSAPIPRPSLKNEKTIAPPKLHRIGKHHETSAIFSETSIPKTGTPHPVALAAKPGVDPDKKELSPGGILGIVSISSAFLSIVMLLFGTFSLAIPGLFIAVLLALAALMAGITGLTLGEQGKLNLKGLSITGIVLSSLILLLSAGLIILIALFDALF